jgi:hypothetical protein
MDTNRPTAQKRKRGETMEIVFAILILIGALAAGSSPSTSQEVHTAKHPAGDSAQTTVAQSIKATPGPCRFPGGRVIQRDLTVPRASVSASFKMHPEEVGHGCADR